MNTLALILIISSVTQSHNADPTDFEVPDSVLGASSITHVGGGIAIECKPFTEWLSRSGAFGSLIALNDKRPFEPLCSEHRVCDIAYLEIREQYDVDHLSYRHNTRKRDELIQVLIAKIELTIDSK